MSKVISLAQSLILKDIIEDIETNEQVKFLHDRSCDFSQVYLYSRPIHVDEIIALIRKVICLEKNKSIDIKRRLI